MTLNYSISRRRFPRRPKSVVTPPARFTLVPASKETWVTEKMHAAINMDDGCIYLNSDNCFRLTGGEYKKLNNVKSPYQTFRDVWWALSRNPGARFKINDGPRLHQGPGNFEATISLTYKVPAQPATKQPRPLSPKLKL